MGAFTKPYAFSSRSSMSMTATESRIMEIGLTPITFAGVSHTKMGKNLTYI